MKNEVVRLAKENGLIVILRGIAGERLLPLVEAMYEGGVRLLEITYDASQRVSDEETARRIGMLSKHFSGRMLIGAGTVLTQEQVKRTADAGGSFIISPHTDGAVIGETVRLGLASIPGALTPTEVVAAHTFGADMVKLFPVSSLGPGYVKALKAPLSHIPLLAVGGVTLENMAEYRRAGAIGFGISSGIVDMAALEKGDYEAIRQRAALYVAAARG